VRFHLPQIIGNFDGDRQIATLKDLRILFDKMVQELDAKGVIAMQRNVLAAAFLDPDTVQATFDSQYVMHGNILSEKLVAFGKLKRFDGEWKVAEARYASDGHMFEKVLSSTNLPEAKKPRGRAKNN